MCSMGANLCAIFLWSTLGTVGTVEDNHPVSSENISILYPKNGSDINDSWVTLLVRAGKGCDPYDVKITVDGEIRSLPKRYGDKFLPNHFFLKLKPGRHDITVSYGGSAKCEDRVTVNVKAGLLSFKPLEMRPLPNSVSVAGFSSVAWGERTALIRSRVDSKEMFWVVPRGDARKAVSIIDGDPHLSIKTKSHYSSSARRCSRDGYVVVADLVENLRIYSLDAEGKVDSIDIDYGEILKRFFEGSAPESWLKRERDLIAWRSISVLPEYLSRPVMCSKDIVVMPMRMACIQVDCKPSNVPVYLIFRRWSGKYEIYKPKKALFDENLGWMGPEILFPVGKNIFEMDLEEGKYRVLGKDETYSLPFLTSLKRGQSVNFGGYVTDFRENSVHIHLKYFDPYKPYDPKTFKPLSTSLGGTIGAVILPDRVLLKQTFLWPGSYSLSGLREYGQKEIYYEME